MPAQLGGRYEIGELLGRGGMAEVHQGRDARLGRTVAVKMLRPDLARDPSFQARFRREAHSAASLNHPSVVAVYDTGEDEFAGNPVPYIVMEHVEGSTLRDLLASGRRLVPERALEITDGVLNALAYSHQQGIVHRDIKPANVMLTRDGEVKVMDFGIARAVADTGATMTQTSAVIGTAQYLSPEQARGEQVDARSDIYSTGCLLYELLTGRPPFVGDSPVSVAYQHVREEPVPPSEFDPDVPANADAIVLKALAKDRAHRYQSAGEMRADIAAALAGRQVAAPAASATQRIDQTSVIGRTSAIPTVLPEEDPRERRDGRGGRAFAYLLLGLAVVAVFVIAALLGRNLLGGGGGETVRVPDLTGLTVEQAQRTLRAEGLRLGEQTQEPSEQVPEGSIISQTPEDANEVEKGSLVDVVVSTGVEETVVPTLVGLSIDEARQALREADLELGNTTQVPSREPRGTVTKVEPKEGKSVEVGESVNLRYASGSNRVPNLEGRTESEARSVLEDAGFVAGQSSTRETRAADPGTVIDQSPGARQSLRLGSTVTFVLAVAPPPPTETPTPTPTPTTTDTGGTPSPTVTPP
ncbi:MAG: Stk1 family PASTA domain-containing Ser/Thr kinase [Sporichthyaceae bacterium]|nr:Stk1 family PASTA domain-containing Ser/Thr kinase [Sporichthyaceae bacterium]